MLIVRGIDLTRIRSISWVFQEKGANFGSNQVLVTPSTSLCIANTYGSAFAWLQRDEWRTVAFIPLSHVVVHRELVRMWAQPKRVVFFLFHVDPVGDEVFVEDVAAQQEGMIGLERFDRAAK